MSRVLYRLLLGASLMLGSPESSVAVVMAPPDITVDVSPPSVAVLALGEQAEIIVTARNELRVEVDQLRVIPSAESGLDVVIDPSQPRSLPPGPDTVLTWTVKITRSASAGVAPSLALHFVYRVIGAAGGTRPGEQTVRVGIDGGVDPVAVTGWATAVLAVVTALLALFAFLSYLGLSRTLRDNRDLVKANMTLADLQRQASTPFLRPKPWERPPPNGQARLNFDVEYFSGTLPAGSVRVWLIHGGVPYNGMHTTMITPFDRMVTIQVNLSDSVPFDVPELRPEDDWFGMMWCGPSGTLNKSSWQFVGGRLTLLKFEQSQDRGCDPVGTALDSRSGTLVQS